MKGVNLDRRVQFLRAGMIDDGYQTRPGPYEPHGVAVWASKRDISDRERFEQATVQSQAETRFQVRWSGFTADITSKDRLICEGQTYAIIGLKEIGRRVGIEITAARVAGDEGQN